MMLGKYFSLAELTQSSTAARLGLSNVPQQKDVDNLRRLVGEVLDPLRERIGRPLRVTSGFRSPAVNAKIPGASWSSRHLIGLAADVKADGLTATDLAWHWLALGRPYDQVIGYHVDRGGHLHLGLSDWAPRQQLLWTPAVGKPHAWVLAE